ncbi:MAG: ComEC/Rec2 family competence protein [Spirochaetales bacterium]
MGRKTIAAWPAADYVRGLTRLILYAIRRKAPPVWVALGAVLAFYGFSARPRAILFASIALAGISTTFRLRGSALSRDLARVGILLSLGLAWGAAAALAETARAAPPELSRFAIVSLEGSVAKDSRRTASGNTMMSVWLENATIASPRFGARLEWPRGRPLVLLVTDSADECAAGRKVSASRLSVIDQEKSLYYASAKNFSAGPFVSAVAGFRCKVKDAFSARIAAVSGKAFPLAQALLLGVTDEIDGEESRLFRDAGCSHILSLSGQHLSVLCMLMTLLVAKLLKRGDLADMASLGFAGAFTWLAGAGPSLLRSMMMVAAGIFLKRSDRPQQGITILSLAFCAGIGLKPEDGRSLSFTLSYAAMAGLILLSPRWECVLWRLPPLLSKPLSASLAALCATASLSISAFGSLPPGGLIAATISGPVVLVFMWSLLGASAIGAVLPFLGGAFSRWHELVHEALLAVMRLGAILPPLSITETSRKAFALAAIVALSLFVYAYPYGEYAFYKIARARRAANFAPQEKNDHSLRFPDRYKNLPRSPRPRDVQAFRPELPRRPEREG